jgi:hypothetical protein
MTASARILELYTAIKPARFVGGRVIYEKERFIVSFNLEPSRYNFTKLMSFENDLYDHFDIETHIEDIRKGCLEVLFGTKGSFCTETIRNHSVAGELDWLAGKYQIGFIEFHSSLLPQRVDYSD